MKLRYLWLSFLLTYVVFVYWFTVFRRYYLLTAGSRWSPLWTYKAIAEGKHYLIGEILINIAMFIPIGILISLISKRVVWWNIVVIGVVLSLGIELLQLSMMRGLCETDDIIHNTIGCLIGFVITSYLIRIKDDTQIS